MKKLISIYRILSLIEIFLLINILLHILFFISKRASQNVDLVIAFLTFCIHLSIGWKIISMTNKNLKANETLVVIGHILNFIKIILLLLLLTAGLFFYSWTNHYLQIDSDKGAWYYLFFLSFLVFLFVVPLTFLTYFGLAKENSKKTNAIIQSIGSAEE